MVFRCICFCLLSSRSRASRLEMEDMKNMVNELARRLVSASKLSRRRRAGVVELKRRWYANSGVSASGISEKMTVYAWFDVVDLV